jgi:hypothetical protein
MFRAAMRHSNHRAEGRRLPRWAAGFAMLAIVAILAGACGANTTSPVPSGLATPSPTPDPHLKGNVTADQMYGILITAKLGLTANNANLGHGNPNIVKQINGVIGGWPIRITEYRSPAALAKAIDWKAGEKPGGDEAPYAWAAMNMLIEFGPISARAPSAPDDSRQATAAAIVNLLDPLMWPIEQHSVVVIPSRTPAPSAAPSASPAPSKAPAKSPKPTPKPSKKP